MSKLLAFIIAATRQGYEITFSDDFSDDVLGGGVVRVQLDFKNKRIEHLFSQKEIVAAKDSDDFFVERIMAMAAKLHGAPVKL